jgi:hypothetical protein
LSRGDKLKGIKGKRERREKCGKEKKGTKETFRPQADPTCSDGEGRLSSFFPFTLFSYPFFPYSLVNLRNARGDIPLT